MSWTDERIETLKKLWADGLSASQIANELGGVTRNAVIGKVHRLGLSGRAKSPTAQTPRPRKAVPAPAMRPTASSGSASRPIVTGIVQGATALKIDTSPMTNALPITMEAIEDVVVPMSRRVSIMELREGVCRWPIGDPMQPDFVYCGADCGIGTVYCGFHSKVAYTPNERRVRETARV
jgi:GcrA cell cycle regulator